MSLSKPRKTFWKVTATVFVLLFGLAFLRTMIKQKTYAGITRMQVKGMLPEAQIVTFLAEQSSNAQSEELLTPVIDALHLNAVWGKRIRVDDELKSWESILLLRQHMELTPLPATKELQIRVVDDSSELAVNIANGVAGALCKTNKARAAMLISQAATPNQSPVSPNIPLDLLVGGLVSLGIAATLGWAAAWMSSAMEKERT